jgi:hypothetical protein
MFRRILFLAVPASFLSLSPVPGQDAGALSPRNANYTIEVRLDSAQKTLEGKEILTWRNLMQMPAQELWFHCYRHSGRRKSLPELIPQRRRGHGETSVLSMSP